jgi:hypothetical protein
MTMKRILTIAFVALVVLVAGHAGADNRRRCRLLAAASSATLAPCRATLTSSCRCGSTSRARRLVVADVERLRLAADRHQHAAVRVELDDHVGHLVHDPHVVLRVDADHVREQESVDTDANFIDEGAFLVELEQPRTAMRQDTRAAHRRRRGAGACVDEDVPLGVGRDARDLAEV